MTRTGNQLLTSLSRYIGDLDFPEGLTTTATGSTTSVVDALLNRFGDDYLNDWYVRITANVAGNQYLNRRVNDFVGSTGTVTTAAFPGTTGSATAYELHRINPSEKFSAMDEARFTAYPALGVLVYNDTLTGDGVTRTFDIPAAVRRGPIEAFIERPVAVDSNWNFLLNPRGDSLTGWTAGSLTATLVAPSATDNIIPKYSTESCTKFAVDTATAATYTQVVASMVNGVTAATAAGRKMTFAAWVYATTASRIRLGLTSDSAITTYGAYHQGGGWELLTVERTIPGANATTLSCVFDMPSGTGAATYFWQRAWFYFGPAEKVAESWDTVRMSDMRRDNTTQNVTFTFIPARGLQLRLIGRALLSELGTVASSQATNVMEVDEAEAELLCAEAVKVLFRRGILSSGVMAALAAPMAVNDKRLAELKAKWKQTSRGPRVTGMWAQ